MEVGKVAKILGRSLQASGYPSIHPCSLLRSLNYQTPWLSQKVSLVLTVSHYKSKSQLNLVHTVRAVQLGWNQAKYQGTRGPAEWRTGRKEWSSVCTWLHTALCTTPSPVLAVSHPSTIMSLLNFTSHFFLLHPCMSDGGITLISKNVY